MTELITEDGQTIKNHGWRVAFAGMGINLALGVLYTWSVISKGIPNSWNWSEADKSWPYAIACLVFSVIMVPAGRLQDRIGPRVVASIGGLLVGLGMIFASRSTSPIGYMINFGILAGAGIGFGYASATPAAVKWFPPARTGLIAGIVVSGFGLASVYAAPLAKWLITTYSLQTMILILGVSFLVVVVGLAQLLTAPQRPIQFTKEDGQAGDSKVMASAQANKKEDFTPKEMLSTVPFYLLWFMYACGAGAGLMIIAKLAAIAKQQAGLELGFLLVVALAIGNGAGRIIAGVASDKLGRKVTLFLCFVLQAILVLLISRAHTGSALGAVPVMALISALLGANYGANLSLFPSITKDYYGLKNFGMNYGLIFTAWGVGGFMMALLAGKVYDQTQSFNFAYYCSSVLLGVAAIMTFLVKTPHHPENTEEVEI